MREPPLNANDLFYRHLRAVMYACGFIGVFVISVPVVYILRLPPSVELGFFALLFGLCHVANYPILRLRWRLWFPGRGGMTPYAAMCITALLFGSFGIPLILLADLLT
mgnify:CR=1 FL=1|jgi:hypothetical protein